MPALDNKPELLPRLIYYVDHFYRLMRDRGYEQGTPLPLANWQIKQYADTFGILDFFDFYEKIVQVDSIYLKTQSEETERKRKQEESKSKSAGRSKTPPKRAPRR